MTRQVKDVHEAAEALLARLNQRYPDKRRMLVDALARSDRPLTAAELMGALHEHVPYSSVYRNLTLLSEAGIVRRLALDTDGSRFELDESLTGHHHHHLICQDCGEVIDVAASPKLERAVAAAANLIADEARFQILDHRLDLIGACEKCRSNQ